MIYRDDDIGKFSDVNLLIEIQKLFDKHKKIHTVTLIMHDLWESRGVWEWLMTTPNLDIALHGWQHVDYSPFQFQAMVDELNTALHYWRENIERMGYEYKEITVFYPPWNKVSDNMRLASSKVGLELNDCVDKDEVYNFHWWEHIGGRGLDKLEEILRHGT